MNLDIETVACPLCGGFKNERIYKSEVFLAGDKKVEVTVNQCENCQFVYNSPRPTEKFFSNFYSDDLSSSGQIFRDETINSYYPKLHNERAKFLFDNIEDKRNISLLDIGCGMGGFIKAIMHEYKNTKTEGIEFSKAAVRKCLDEGLNVSGTKVEDLIRKKIKKDVVSLISVLEHALHPRDLIKKCRRLLKKTGKIFIEVPNLFEPTTSISGYFCFEHIVHFTPCSLKDLLIEEGFKSFYLDTSVKKVVRLIGSLDLDLLNPDKIADFSKDQRDAKMVIYHYHERQERFKADIKNKLEGLINQWKSRGLKIAMYGAGMHSLELSKIVNFQSSIEYFIDGDVRKHGKKFLGVPIVPPQHLSVEKVEALFISSGTFREEMTEKARYYAGRNLIIENCYD